MSTRTTIFIGRIPLVCNFHVYRNYGQLYVEFGEAYSDWTLELPRFWRRRKF